MGERSRYGAGSITLQRGKSGRKEETFNRAKQTKAFSLILPLSVLAAMLLVWFV